MSSLLTHATFWGMVPDYGAYKYMRLKDYLEKHSLPTRHIAKKMGVTVSAARKWVQGTRIPRLPAIKKINRLTQGEVSFDDWR